MEQPAPVAMTPPAALARRAHRLRAGLFGVSLALLGGCDPGGSGGGIDPGVVEIPVAYIKGPVPRDDAGDEIQPDLRDPLLFVSGGDVYLRSASSAGADETNISLAVTGGRGDARGLSASHDGTRLVFSLREFDANENDDLVPSWNIYEYNLEDSTLRRVISSAVLAEQGNDLHPSYLPDGRILFTSDRQSQSREMRINEGKEGFASLDEDRRVRALVLHVMNSDGSDIHQISFNQSHDLYPQVLTHFDAGRIVFSRWDNAAGNSEMNIYTANPDGSDLQILYGSHSHGTGTSGASIQFVGLRETEDGDLMVITRPFSGTYGGGNIEIIDVNRFADNRKSIWRLGNLPGQAQREATVSSVANDGSISVNGRYASAFPLWDGSDRLLVTKSTCQLQLNDEIRPCIDPYLSDPAAVEASPPYGIWLYDMVDDTQKPLVIAAPGSVISEAIAIEQRSRAPVIFDRQLTGDLDRDWRDEKVGVVNIRSVYDRGDTTFDGCFFGICTSAQDIVAVQDFADPAKASADQRPARFVRFTKAVGIPDRDDPTLEDPPNLDNDAFGPQRNRGMREIVGYAPVEPDGSVKVKVPANVPLAVEVLDREGRRIGPRHDNWFQVQPGDTLDCVGCHDPGNGGNPPEIHGRADGEAPSINAGLANSGRLDNTLIPGTLSPNPYVGNPGLTLAELRFASVGLAVPPASQPRPSVDLEYVDYWTDPVVRDADASYAYSYQDLDAALVPPTNSFCTGGWVYNCRVIINYPQHIQAIFQLDRGADLITPLPPDNPPSDDSANTPLNFIDAMPDGIGDQTCVSCHTSAGNTRLPYGQLDLTTDANQDPNDRYRSYRQLFDPREGRFVDAGGNLVPFTVVDADGNSVADPAATIQPLMTAAGARASFFIEMMSGQELDARRALPAASSVDHAGMLSAAELRMIGEWLDIGAQNFNDPFDPAAPQN